MSAHPAEQAPAPTAGALPPALTELLAAIRDALDVPLADRPADDKQRAELLTRRAADTRVIVELLLAHGNAEHHTARLREWTAEHPVTYPTWQTRADEAAAEEEQLIGVPEPIGPGCGAPATVRFEGYSPRNGLAHGSLDLAVYACAEHAPRARAEWLGDLMPYRTLTAGDALCGHLFDFTTLGGGR
ncbi:hypothetical protein [Streptomyces chartreusis]